MTRENNTAGDEMRPQGEKIGHKMAYFCPGILEFVA